MNQWTEVVHKVFVYAKQKTNLSERIKERTSSSMEVTEVS